MDKQKFFHHSWDVKTSKVITFIFSLLIGVVLIIAAIGKVFFPIESLKIFERCVGGFEILFFLMIFFFRNQWQMWLVAMLIFGAWEGFALFWVKVKLPCNCMGAMAPVPTGLSLVLDLLFYLGSLTAGIIFGAERKFVYLSVLCSLFAGLVGFALADSFLTQIYKA